MSDNDNEPTAPVEAPTAEQVEAAKTNVHPDHVDLRDVDSVKAEIANALSEGRDPELSQFPENAVKAVLQPSAPNPVKNIADSFYGYPSAPKPTLDTTEHEQVGDPEGAGVVRHETGDGTGNDTDVNTNDTVAEPNTGTSGSADLSGSGTASSPFDLTASNDDNGNKEN